MQGRDGLRLETELRLGLPGCGGGDGGSLVEKNEKKRVFCDISSELIRESKAVKKNDQVVGWPPVCSYRQRNSFKREDERKTHVKVSMDGAPFLRKIDLSTQKNYSNLVLALEGLFGCFGIGEAMEDHSDYVLIYEDKDGDWMLVGDVPWEMFSESCKRLRIKKRSDANGIGLHAKDLLKEISKGD